VAKEFSHYAGFYLEFRTQGDVRDFLATYGLSSSRNVPKADTLKTSTHREIKEAKERAIQDAEYRAREEETTKLYYNHILELNRIWDSLLGRQADRKAIDASIKEFETAPDSVRSRMIYEKLNEGKRLKDSVYNKKKDQGELLRGGSGTATLTLSIQNVKNTGDSAGRYLEFDIMLRTDMPNTYLTQLGISMRYESDSLDKPFKKSI